ncbi:MAG: lamin tail domain-containing protein, partial [Deltaproteobacteria bacterium]|nr:lamin tail domain-containing protein [Deltaproteobacteria bacterium]
PQASWEFLVVTRFGSAQVPAVYTPGFVEVGLGTTSAVLMGDFIEIGVPFSVGLDALPPAPLQFTVVSLRANAIDEAWDVAGVSDVMDAVTNYGDPGLPGNTWDEVSDALVDYHFSVWFHLDPDIEPSAPLVVNEVLYDPVIEPDEEWIEIFNRTGIDGYSLDGHKVGDEETVDGAIEGMVAFPVGGTINLDSVVVMANDGLAYETLYGFPADFELNDAGATPDMIDYPLWTGSNILLANASDQLLLLDPFDTVIDAIAYGGGTYPGVIAGVNVVQGHSLERPQAREDSNDCLRDFVDRSTPTPGQVSWLLDLGQACDEWIECLSDFCADSVCCENACDLACDFQCDASGSCLEVSCPAPTDACQLANCDAVTLCSAASGTACEDGDACTQNDSCDGSGNCQAGAPLVCPAPSGPCELAVCDSVTGCLAAAGTLCDDSDACTQNTTCDASGNCVNGTPLFCDDGDVCTDNNCIPASGCDFPNNTAACDDSDPCTHTDTCSGGACAGVPYVCDDSNPCTDDSCDGDNTCTFSQNSDICDDADPCSYDDVCVAGVCTGNPYSCDDGNVCTDDTCLGDSNCSYADNTAACDDGYACTRDDVCAGGSCSGILYSCDDNDVCTDDACLGDGTCLHTDNLAACDNGDLCTENDACVGGTCMPGNEVDCNDNNPCTNDSCVSTLGCVNDFNVNPCDDGDACTENDTCQAGACVGSPVV